MTLNRGEKNALRRFSRDSGSYQAVSKWKGIGLPSMRSLVEKGLVVEGPSGIYGPTFKLTVLGAAWRERVTTSEPRGAVLTGPVELRSEDSTSREPVLA